MASSEPKTRPTNASVNDFIAAQSDPERVKDCKTLLKMMRQASGEKPVMWGDAIVGFGHYTATYASGRRMEWMRIAFSPRKNDLTVYLVDGFEHHAELLRKLGRYKTGRVCLYIKRLADVDVAVLQALMEASVARMKQLYPPG